MTRQRFLVLFCALVLCMQCDAMARGHISREVQRERMTLVAQILWTLGAATTVWAIWFCLNTRRSRTWPAVRGEVMASHVRRFAPTSAGNWDWSIRYRYVVDGRAHAGWRVYFGMTVPLTVARAMVARFPASTHVDVRYDPRRPERSVLLPGVNRYTATSLLPGPFFAVLGLVFWLLR